MDTQTAPSPSKLAHLVIRTSRFDESVAWWKNVLVADARYENEFIAFLTYDDEHHRLAILAKPDLGDEAQGSVGLEHVAFTYGSFEDLMTTYERLRDDQIEPLVCVNHGMTFSLYYADPDGNQVELQVDTMSLDEAEVFMASETFAMNPIGEFPDIADIFKRYKDGETFAELTRYGSDA